MEARHRIGSAIAAIEHRTSAEVVVAVHPRSAGYREAEWLLAVLFAVAWLLLFLYHPEPFEFTWLPFELAGVGLVGWVLSRGLRPLKRALVLDRTLTREVDRSAKAAFVDLGVSRTRGRTGVLVFVSLLEGQARVLCDVGVPALGPLSSWSEKLSRAARKNDVSAVVDALGEIGPALENVLPRAATDENELPDAPVQGES